MARVSGPGETYFYPLNAAKTIRVKGALGDTVVCTGGGEAWIIYSPCRNQICVSAPPVRGKGQWTACLPNQVMISIESGGMKTTSKNAVPDGIDAATW
jgi:hypothetical protein